MIVWIQRNVITRELIFLGLTLWAMVLCGCAPREEEWLPVSDPSSAWVAHQTVLDSLHAWKMEGKVAVSTGAQAESIHFQWIQEGPSYEIHFYGPLGVGVATLTKKETEISLLTSSGQHVAKDPERLMLSELGFSLPISGLERWMVGLPESTGASLTLNAFGYLQSLNEAGWDIAYLNYQRVGSLGVPRQIVLKREGLRVIVRIESFLIKTR